MTRVLTLKGGWTHKDVQDAEDNLESERFQVTGNTIQVKYRSEDDVQGWWRHPLEDQLISWRNSSH
jgi:hypothetical protein